jgi:molybdopterin synthase sulfur carrier subunit
MVKVRFSSALNNVTGTRETTFNLGDTSVKNVFYELISKFGPEFEKRIFENGEIRRFVNVYVNGEDIRHLSGLDTPVTDADEISLLPAVSGGEKANTI